MSSSRGLSAARPRAPLFPCLDWAALTCRGRKRHVPGGAQPERDPLILEGIAGRTATRGPKHGAGRGPWHRCMPRAGAEWPWWFGSWERAWLARWRAVLEFPCVAPAFLDCLAAAKSLWRRRGARCVCTWCLLKARVWFRHLSCGESLLQHRIAATSSRLRSTTRRSKMML